MPKNKVSDPITDQTDTNPVTRRNVTKENMTTATNEGGFIVPEELKNFPGTQFLWITYRPCHGFLSRLFKIPNWAT
ncbi:MAG TPA: hypothetical protein VFE27_25325 [Acidobacteriaceae bacterium]|nr:hypothetical protein [Acidobacteriaceae bacterium]